MSDSINKQPESWNHQPVVIAIGSDAGFKDKLYNALISCSDKTWISLPKTSDDFKTADFKVFFFSDKQDDRLLPDISKKGSLVVYADDYPNKMILHELKGAGKIKLYTTVKEIGWEILTLLSNFKKIGTNMNYIDQTHPRTGNIFFRNGGADPRGWQCPAIVTNNIKGGNQFNCIGLDDFTDQEYSTGNGETEYLSFVGLRERLEKNRKGENADLILKNLKLRISKMKNLKL